MVRTARARVAIALLTGALVMAACGSDSKKDDASSASTTTEGTATTTKSVLGTPDPAKGEPVKVGLIMSGKGAAFDTSIDEPVAKAAFDWINEYRGGIGGRPVKLVVCSDHQVPAEAADCAAQMIQDDVVAVVYGANGQFEASWRPLHAAGIPTYIFIGGGSEEAGADPDSTFMLNDSRASTVAGPIALAKKLGTKKISVVAVDLPAATSVYTEGDGPAAFKRAGIDFDLVPVALGQADMTPEMIKLVKKNDDGVVLILGTDGFCLAALQGLQAAGFKGSIAANEVCIGDSTKKSIPGSMLKGIRTHMAVPLGDDSSESTKLFKGVLEKYAPGTTVDGEGAYMFLAVTGLDVATSKLTGAVTAKSVTEATKTMDWVEWPGSGGRHIRCGGKADPKQPAVCSEGVLYSVRDEHGEPAKFEVIGDDRIG